MTFDEIQKILVSEEPTEEFREWVGTRFGEYNEYKTPLSTVRKMWCAYQKGIRNAMHGKSKIVTSEVFVLACGNCGETLDDGYNFCPNCGTVLDWSE